MLYAILGSSGSGKTTIGEQVFGKDRELVSTTTRPKRKNETNGIDYHFVNKTSFALLKQTGALAEYSEYAENQYGLTHDEIHSKTKKGNSYVVIDYNGFLQLKNEVKDVRGVFIYVNKKTATSRLLARGETPEFISKRLELYENELGLMEKVDYVIENDNSLEESIVQFKKIIRKEAARPAPTKH